jgi:1,2-diacylglycerol 3-beta-galactosyltransferase
LDGKPGERGIHWESAQLSKKPKIVFLFSDTGGGHRSAAEAIIEALEKRFPDRFDTEMVDFFKDYGPPPLNMAGPTYPAMSNMKLVWYVGYKILDDKKRMDALYDTLKPYTKPYVKKLFAEHPSDLFVSVHSIVNQPILSSQYLKVPMVIVVVDLVYPPAFWYQDKTDLIITPTEPAYQRGLLLGVPPEKMTLVGLPISSRFIEMKTDPAIIRKKYGWALNRPLVLMIGGGEGMGKIKPSALAINKANLPVSLVIVTGKNQKLMKQLKDQTWNIPVHIYGFSKELPEFMQAADIVLTKAGPTTLCEAFQMGKPIIIFSYVPGQEKGNVIYTVDKGAGVYASTADRVVGALRYWLENPDKMAEVARASKELSRPEAAGRIADILAEHLEKK